MKIFLRVIITASLLFSMGCIAPASSAAPVVPKPKSHGHVRVVQGINCFPNAIFDDLMKVRELMPIMFGIDVKKMNGAIAPSGILFIWRHKTTGEFVAAVRGMRVNKGYTCVVSEGIKSQFNLKNMLPDAEEIQAF